MFIAPESYHGDFKLSYGHSLTIVFILENSNPQFTDSAYIRCGWYNVTAIIIIIIYSIGYQTQTLLCIHLIHIPL